MESDSLKIITEVGSKVIDDEHTVPNISSTTNNSLPAYRNMGYGMLPGLEILPNLVPGLHHDVLHGWYRLGEAIEALQMLFWKLLGRSSVGPREPLC